MFATSPGEKDWNRNNPIRPAFSCFKARRSMLCVLEIASHRLYFISFLKETKLENSPSKFQIFRIKAEKRCEPSWNRHSIRMKRATCWVWQSTRRIKLCPDVCEIGKIGRKFKLQLGGGVSHRWKLFQVAPFRIFRRLIAAAPLVFLPCLYFLFLII